MDSHEKDQPFCFELSPLQVFAQLNLDVEMLIVKELGH